MSTEIKASIVRAIAVWIEDHASNDDFNWSQYWYDEDLDERMAAAAYAVFMAARDAQDFAKEREKENAS
jgi:hypothetical protein